MTMPRLQADGRGFSEAASAMRGGALGPSFRQDAGADLLRRAVRAGVAGATPNLDAHGSVVVRVDRAGPDARVRTSTEGDLFRQVKTMRGRTMMDVQE